MFSCEFCEIYKNTSSYRTPPVAASEDWKFMLSNATTERCFQKWPFQNPLKNYLKIMCKGQTLLITFLMENATLLKCNDFTPSQVFFKNFNLCTWILVIKNVSKEHLQ